jgi:hypothetical protein
METQDAFDCGLFVGVVLAAAGYLAWPSIERWVKSLSQDRFKRTIARDPMLRDIEARIARARKRHWPVRHLLDLKTARVTELLRREVGAKR